MAEKSGSAATRYRHDDAQFLRRTLTAMRNYQKDCRVAYKHRSLAAFSQEHRARLMDVGFADYLGRVSDCIESNQVGELWFGCYVMGKFVSNVYPSLCH